MGREDVYISVDIEASGPYAPKYSMLSVGACLVDGNANSCFANQKKKSSISKYFYREIKPLNLNYNKSHLKIAVLGLHGISKFKDIDKFNPKNSRFNPELVLKKLGEVGEKPEFDHRSAHSARNAAEPP